MATMESTPTATLLVLACALAGCGSEASATGEVVPQRNVLLILLDDMGVDGPGCYAVGGDPAPTPNIDALAAEGVRFANAWAMPICSPTRAAIQSGRYGFRTGIGDLVRIPEDGFYFSEAETTLPEMLDLGTNGRYAHAAFGKWHLGNVGADGKAAANVNGYGHFSGGLLRSPGGYFQWRHNENGVEREREGYLTQATVEDAIAWLDSAPEPWFCYLALHAPHTEHHVPPADLCSLEVAEGEEPGHREKYKAMLEAADTMIGRLLESLGDARERTAIVLTSDNGTATAAEPPHADTRRGKGSVHEGGVHVPLIVAGPDVGRSGSVCEALVHVLDLFATVADLAGVDLDATLPEVELDSQSLLPLVADPDAPSRRSFLYTELFSPNGFKPRARDRRAIRDARYKLIQTRTGEEFFDLRDDPFERENLMTAGLPDELRSRYEALSEAMNEFGTGSGPLPSGQRNASRGDR